MTRIYGRTKNADGSKSWVVLDTDQGASSDEVNFVWLAQVLKLNTGESPFYADWGIDAYQAVQSQIYPDLSVQKTQQRFSSVFPYISIQRASSPDPYYTVTILSSNGTTFSAPVPG